ncbi:hypothetical protein BD289DRAFT_440102 [Coniella lustricola]|uniref:Uncharacterized protein n=1 Tax=Coniella lustricola TaxID=2025994 RepID=A0A2T3A0Y0_9PEZI|nr:hypothetical protein BD289DRAFT_440102 [Coniella lustricola]
MPSMQTADEPSHLTISVSKTAHADDKVSVTLPLANTLFQNGRRSTLLASKWAAQAGGLMAPLVPPCSQLLQMLDKRCQTVCLPPSSAASSSPSESSCLAISSSLTPITWPRMILESLGNILAKVDIEGVPSPASKELQANVPRLMEARRSTETGYKNAQARVSVWAAIIPGKLVLPAASTNATPRVHPVMGSEHGSSETEGPASLFNLFTHAQSHERQGWPAHVDIGPALLKGCRLHRIMSGGGEWGAKASLLSLDPQTSYGLENEQDELLRFQRSFFGEEEADEAIAKPGDFVQFYVDKEVHPLREAGDNEPTEGEGGLAGYPRVVFGVSEPSLAESEASLPADDSVLATATNELAWLVPDHFGGISTEALYIESASLGVKTKLDAPGMRITLGSRRRF